MLILEIPARDAYDEELNEFFCTPKTRLTLEHSLLSVRKWESVWKTSFLQKLEKKEEGFKPIELQDYVRCMTINSGVDINVYRTLTAEELKTIFDYMLDPMSATTFSNAKPNTGRKETVTAELIYWWMSSLQIPFECEKWHLNQLMNLIHIASIKNQPSKKMSKRDIMKSNSSLNAARRARMGSKG